MKTWFVTLQFGIVGCVGYQLLEAETAEQAYEEAYGLCVEHAQSYGYEQDKDVFGDLDTVGCDFDEETGEYALDGFLDPGVEVYVPELHDQYLY